MGGRPNHRQPWAVPDFLAGPEDPDRQRWAATVLQTYFHDRRDDGDPLYTGAVFDRLAGGGAAPAVANRFTADDSSAAIMLSVSVDPRALRMLETETDDLSALLAEVPVDLDLIDAEGLVGCDRAVSSVGVGEVLVDGGVEASIAARPPIRSGAPAPRRETRGYHPTRIDRQVVSVSRDRGGTQLLDKVGHRSLPSRSETLAAVASAANPRRRLCAPQRSASSPPHGGLPMRRTSRALLAWHRLAHR
jgi:hypothetical protein